MLAETFVSEPVLNGFRREKCKIFFYLALVHLEHSDEKSLRGFDHFEIANIQPVKRARSESSHEKTEDPFEADVGPLVHFLGFWIGRRLFVSYLCDLVSDFEYLFPSERDLRVIE